MTKKKQVTKKAETYKQQLGHAYDIIGEIHLRYALIENIVENISNELAKRYNVLFTSIANEFQLKIDEKFHLEQLRHNVHDGIMDLDMEIENVSKTYFINSLSKMIDQDFDSILIDIFHQKYYDSYPMFVDNKKWEKIDNILCSLTEIDVMDENYLIKARKLMDDIKLLLKQIMDKTESLKKIDHLDKRATSIMKELSSNTKLRKIVAKRIADELIKEE